MIEITEIKDPIAKDMWATKAEDGKPIYHRIVVGHPHPETKNNDNSDWYCPVMIEGFLPRIFPAMGVGPVDSLMNAMQLVKTFFDKNKDNFVEIGKER